jgi:hypothetical protein
VSFLFRAGNQRDFWPARITGSSHPQVALLSAGQPALKADTSATNATESVNDFLLQIRELTSANLDLLSIERTIKYD